MTGSYLQYAAFWAVLFRLAQYALPAFWVSAADEQKMPAFSEKQHPLILLSYNIVPATVKTF